MDEEAWLQRLTQIETWYLKRVDHVRAEARARARPDLAHLEAALASTAALLQTPWPTTHSLYEDPRVWNDGVRLLQTLKELPWANRPRLAQHLTKRAAGVPDPVFQRRARHLLMMLYGASRAFQNHARAVRLEVPANLQCALLATEPPDVVVWADVALPAEGFILNVPYAEIEASDSEGARAQGPLAATHVFVAPLYPTGPERSPNTEVGLVLLSPVEGLFIWGDSAVRRQYLHQYGGGMRLYQRYLLNLLIYLKAGAASLAPRYAEEIAKIEAVPRKKRRKVQEERLKRLKADTVFNVTTTLPLDPNIKDFVHAGGLATPTWTLKNRTLVRGHWRNQACGEGRKERKLIPIAPHFRGPDLGAQIAATAHTYKVK